ncbi:MAG: hypothetical protein HY530_06740 [Chloroflexi bacterium]|nr:hypothetical protein [Chloroflexota bacterium]
MKSYGVTQAPARPKVGLAHIGVLQVLEREGIPIDMIAGASSELLLDLTRKRLVPLIDLALPRTGFIAGRKLMELLADGCPGRYAHECILQGEIAAQSAIPEIKRRLAL